MIALDVPFDIKLRAPEGDWSKWRTEIAEVIPSDAHHHLVAHGPMAFFYLDPMSDDHSKLSKPNLISGRRRLIEMSDPSISNALEL